GEVTIRIPHGTLNGASGLELDVKCLVAFLVFARTSLVRLVAGSVDGKKPTHCGSHGDLGLRGSEAESPVQAGEGRTGFPITPAVVPDLDGELFDGLSADGVGDGSGDVVDIVALVGA